MNICYFDLNLGTESNGEHFESYVLNASKYGGGSIFAKYAKELLNNGQNTFHIFADPICFKGAINENTECFKPISLENRDKIRNGHPIKDLIPEIIDYDLIVHHFSNVWINTEGTNLKQTGWSLGYSELVHQNFCHYIFYNEYQSPRFLNPNTKIKYAPIGKPIPPFQEHQKQNYIFQCTRHCPSFGSINVARFCAHHKIPVIFAGPLDNGYPLMDYVDGNIVKYLGVISEEEKVKLTKEARLYTFIHNWPTPFNLSSIESLSHGTPIVATNVGFWPSLIEEGNNGFIINSFEDLLKAYENAPKLNQLDCYNSVKDFNVENMVNGFYKVFEEILNK